MDLAEELTKIADVLRRKRYLFLAGAIAAVAFTVYALLLNLGLLHTLLVSGQYGLFLEMVPRLTWGYVMTTTNVSLLMSVLISAAIGVNFTLVIFRLVEMSAVGAEGASSLGGMALAVVAPACPACATTLFAYAGISSVFALLPFKGTEIKVLALLFLAGSSVWIAKEINREICELCEVEVPVDAAAARA